MEWHKRLGHLGDDDINLLAQKKENLHITENLNDPICESCQLAKGTRIPNSHPATH